MNMGTILTSFGIVFYGVIKSKFNFLDGTLLTTFGEKTAVPTSQRPPYSFPKVMFKGGIASWFWDIFHLREPAVFPQLTNSRMEKYTEAV